MFEKSKTPSFYPETTIFCVENPRNTQVLLAVFSLNLTVSGQKSVISSIFKQALVNFLLNWAGTMCLPLD
ncbi:hypothetical protein [Acutalibacter caecimuris]|uniref:hypothetical protein n=1 Tax=Acutalibacter caecimuris TaxID=3093657 RepID=UPI002AC8A218|nr:hypothetical protein [Acutalibacter sp. M00118]